MNIKKGTKNKIQPDMMQIEVYRSLASIVTQKIKLLRKNCFPT